MRFFEAGVRLRLAAPCCLVRGIALDEHTPHPGIMQRLLVGILGRCHIQATDFVISLRMLSGILMLLGFQLMEEVLHRLSGLPVPGVADSAKSAIFLAC